MLWLLPPERRVIRLNINAELGEFVQLRSYLICKGGGLGTEFRKKAGHTVGIDGSEMVCE